MLHLVRFPEDDKLSDLLGSMPVVAVMYVEGCNVTVAPWPLTSRCSREGIDTWLAPPNGTNARAACSALKQTEEVFEAIGGCSYPWWVSMKWERGRARTVCKGERGKFVGVWFWVVKEEVA